MRQELGMFGTRRQRTGLIGLAVPSLREPWFAQMVAQVVEFAPEFGFSVAVLQTSDSVGAEHGAVSGVGFPEVDGVLVVPRFLTAADLTRRPNPLPLVLLGEHVERSTFCHVTVDNRLAMREITAHLAALGCTRIAMIGRRSSPASDAAGRRELGFLDAVGEVSGIAYEVIDVPEFSLGAGRRAVLDLFVSGSGSGPDGLACVNDSLALGAMRGLRELGLAIPGDVAVAGFDDIPMAAYSNPPLTTVTPDLPHLARSALELLHRQLNAPLAWTPDMEQVTVGHRLTIRESTEGHTIRG
ncbi:LacI family DNA-binding transcriptional regulator [Tessaracoccus oleiagri]|nr:LacI family DNA-binding transcriptional regulator [Tessaracoccus oleiagri]